MQIPWFFIQIHHLWYKIHHLKRIRNLSEDTARLLWLIVENHSFVGIKSIIVRINPSSFSQVAPGKPGRPSPCVKNRPDSGQNSPKVTDWLQENGGFILKNGGFLAKNGGFNTNRAIPTGAYLTKWWILNWKWWVLYIKKWIKMMN